MRLLDELERIGDACGVIQDGGACDKCPMWATCMQDTSAEEWIYAITESMIDEMIGFSKDVEDHLARLDFQKQMEWERYDEA